MKKILLMVVGVTALVAAAIGGTLYVTGSMAVSHAPASVSGAAAPVPSPAVSEPIHVAIDPAFTVNIDDGFATRFLQIEITVMHRDKTASERLTQAMPHIRNDVLLLLSAKNRETISTVEGRLALQAEILKTINDVLREDTGSGGVEAVYFTKLVLQ